MNNSVFQIDGESFKVLLCIWYVIISYLLFWSAPSSLSIYRLDLFVAVNQNCLCSSVGGITNNANIIYAYVLFYFFDDNNFHTRCNLCNNLQT